MHSGDSRHLLHDLMSRQDVGVHRQTTFAQSQPIVGTALVPLVEQAEIKAIIASTRSDIVV